MKSAFKSVLVSIAVLAISLASSSVAIAQKMRAHFLDVGQGSAAILEFPCAAILVDTGGESNSDFNSTEALMQLIDEFFAGRSDLKGTFHSIVLSHPHIDHTRGVKAVLEKYKTLNAVTNGQEVSSGKPGQVALHRKVAESEQSTDPKEHIGFEPIRVRDIPAGSGKTNAVIDPVNCGTVDPKITALWGTADRGQNWTKADFDNQNNHSVVLRVDFGKASMLLTGDLEEKGIAGLLAHYKDTKMLDADVYLVGHHGAANATTDALLRAVTPDLAVMSMGSPSREVNWTAWAYGHPRKVTVDLLVKRVGKTRQTTKVTVATGVKTFVPMSLSRAIYATGWDGTVVLEADVDGTWTPVGSGAVASVATSSTPTLLNINTASADDFTTLPMIGTKRAGDIVAFRSKNGPFGSVEDLAKVPGIGLGTIKAIRPLVRIN